MMEEGSQPYVSWLRLFYACKRADRCAFLSAGVTYVLPLSRFPPVAFSPSLHSLFLRVIARGFAGVPFLGTTLRERGLVRSWWHRNESDLCCVRLACSTKRNKTVKRKRARTPRKEKFRSFDRVML